MTPRQTNYDHLMAKVDMHESRGEIARTFQLLQAYSRQCQDDPRFALRYADLLDRIGDPAEAVKQRIQGLSMDVAHQASMGEAFRTFETDRGFLTALNKPLARIGNGAPVPPALQAEFDRRGLSLPLAAQEAGTDTRPTRMSLGEFFLAGVFSALVLGVVACVVVGLFTVIQTGFWRLVGGP